MTEEEFNNQCNRCGRLVTYNEQFYIGPLTYEIKEFESMVRYYQQQKKRMIRLFRIGMVGEYVLEW